MTETPIASLRVDGVQGLLVTRYTVDEGVSRPFEAAIEVASEAHDIGFDAVAMRPASLSIRAIRGARHVHGIVARWEYLHTGLHYSHYRITVVPRAHRLALRKDVRIFQRLTTPEIAREVLLGAGLHADEFRLDVVGDHPRRDYCVQYRETDLEFLHRILAREGMFYFFEHGEGGCVLVLADHPQAHGPAPGLDGPLRHDAGFASSRERLTEFRPRARLAPGKVTLRDFDPLRPSMPMQVDRVPGLDADLEVYDFPGGFVEEGLPFLQLGGSALGSRFGEVHSDRASSEGTSDCPVLTPGHTLHVADNPRADLDGEYVITSLVHEGRQPGIAQVDAREPGSYSNRFTCLPAGVPVPLPRARERPQIPGIQSAIVVGPAGQPIHTDHLGRIKVQFHWDRKGARDERSSCWVRVVHPWGGHQHGFLSVPRVGTEVAVAFFEGDPDRPLVLGCLYSDDNAAPHALPAAHSRTALRSQSVPGSGHNELCFEDRGGDEQVFLRAERDYSVYVQRDAKTTIDRGAHTTVKDARTARVGAENLTVDHDRNEAIGGDSFTAVDGALVLDAGTFVLRVERGAAIKAGDLGLSADGALAVSATKGVSLRGPGGFITINAQGVFIQGTRIFLNSGGAPLEVPRPEVPQHDPPPSPTAAEEP
ncbi:type VI secretion system tip protein TssI/VgrG [Nannocystis sp. SCPEA4]|uniref:type VI secretion system Vgr family protein n=1 Tax=Nannocystis sp. SCPEA4 TaxID=2996787 RepID=UPI00226FB748|nr:type VI secretion system tip protein TssI/VgrG [Nannocystis sp. SCPEA4]MCY1060208.1 type VI secretion system tip protein TssI/VgrG [Nannocystis sp. SCPEA4]